jgi:hypothetical protein
MLCSVGELDKVLAAPKGRAYGEMQLTRLLVRLSKISAADHERALERVRVMKGADLATDFRHRVEQRAEFHAKRQARADAKAAEPSIQEQWGTSLERRRPTSGELTEAQQDDFDKRVLKDRATARRKIFLPGPENSRKHATQAAEASESVGLPPSGDVAPNDTSLPAASITEEAKMVEQWCKFGSWGMCRKCGSLRPRPLHQQDLHRVAKPTMPKCSLCTPTTTNTQPVYVPQPEHVPAELRDLPSEAVKALRPFKINVGEQGSVRDWSYRTHQTMITFSWASKGIRKRIKKLPPDLRPPTRAAYEYLMNSELSDYSKYIGEHEKFLEKYQRRKPTEKQRKMPLRFIEREGLECALWPHLYWHRNLCETVGRQHDERHMRARRTALTDDEDSEDDGNDLEENTSDDDDGESEPEKAELEPRASKRRKV